jgi:hypothetical protein
MSPRLSRVLLAAVVLWIIHAGPARGQRCAGNADGFVLINELITCVSIALGESPMDTCLAADVDGVGGVGINDPIAAVNAALFDCATSGTIRVQQISRVLFDVTCSEAPQTGAVQPDLASPRS